MRKSFIRGGYSFRPETLAHDGREIWQVYRKGERTFGWAAPRATLTAASDFSCWVVSQHGQAVDGRVSFEEACDLALSRI